MSLKKITNLVLTFGLLAFGAASCDILDPWDPGNGGGNGGGGNGGGCGDTVITLPEEMVKAAGTIRLVTDDRGAMFFGIEGADNQNYEPINLPEAFMEDGLQVKFEGYLLQDWGSSYGKLIEIVKIERAD